MVSLQTKDDDYAEPLSSSRHGYGTRISLNAEQCANLGIKEPLRAGTKVKIAAFGFVENVSESAGDADGDENGKGGEISLCLQLTDMELSQARDSSRDSKTLYPDQG